MGKNEGVVETLCVCERGGERFVMLSSSVRLYCVADAVLNIKTSNSEISFSCYSKTCDSCCPVRTVDAKQHKDKQS